MAIITVTAWRGARSYDVARYNTDRRTPTEADLADDIQAAQRIEALKPGQRVTKWDVIGDRERGQLDRTSFLMWDGDVRVPGVCSTCGTDIGTEGEFARHFVLDDIRHKNLGRCPSSLDT